MLSPLAASADSDATPHLTPPPGVADARDSAPGATAPNTTSPLTAPAPLAASTYAGGLRSQKVRLADVRQAGPTPQQQLTRVDVTRNLTSKKISAKVTFAKAPTSARNSLVYVFLGTWSGNTCQHRAVIAAAASGTSADGAFFASDGSVAAPLPTTRSRTDTVLTITSAARDRIRTGAWDCAFAYNDAGTGTSPTLFTSLYAESLQDTFVPRLEVTTRASMQGNYKGKTTKVNIHVDNDGKSEVKNITVTASGTGLKISQAKKTIATLKKGGSKMLTFSVKLASGTQRTLTVSAVASGGKKASTKVTIVEKPKPKKYSSLSGRYFWGYMPTTLSSNSGWETRAVWFLNSKWAYVTVPKDGKKPTCTTASAACKRYSYNAKTGVAKIGSQKFAVTTEGFTYKARKKDSKKSNFEPIALASKGARYSTILKRDDWSGYCAITCTTTSERIKLAKDGKFVWQRSSIGNWSGIGSSWAIVPPDQRGTYRVISTGRIELRYSDGKVKRHLFGVVRDLRGKTTPKEGVIVGGKNFY